MSEAMTAEEIAEIDASIEAKPKQTLAKKAAKPSGWASDRTNIQSKSGIYFFATCAMKVVVDQDGEEEERKVIVVYMADSNFETDSKGNKKYARPQDYPKALWKRVKKRQFEAVRLDYADMPLDVDEGLKELSL